MSALFWREHLDDPGGIELQGINNLIQFNLGNEKTVAKKIQPTENSTVEKRGERKMDLMFCCQSENYQCIIQTTVQ